MKSTIVCLALCATLEMLADAQSSAAFELTTPLVPDTEQAAIQANVVYTEYDDDDDEDELEQATSTDETTPAPAAPVWTNAYVPNNRDTCNGTVAGFSETPLTDAECLAPFQFLLKKGSSKVRYGCFKCDSEMAVDRNTMPYASCDGQPICSDLPLAYYKCFLANDATTDVFACLMEIDFQLRVER